VLPALAMYFREDQKKGFRRFLSSVPVQLCRRSDSYSGILSDLHSERDDGFDGFDDPRDNAVVRCLKRLLELPRQAPIFLMVNALDEYRNTPALSFPLEKSLCS
jgi:hypothetical protein